MKIRTEQAEQIRLHNEEEIDPNDPKIINIDTINQKELSATEKAETIAKLKDIIKKGTTKIKELAAEEKDILKKLAENEATPTESPIKIVGKEVTEPATALESPSKLDLLKKYFAKIIPIMNWKGGKEIKGGIKQLTSEEEELEKIKQKQAEALEIERVQNLFKYFLIDQMSDEAFQCLFSKTKAEATLNNINRLFGENSRVIKFSSPNMIVAYRQNTVFLSSNGFTLQLQNGEEITTDGKKMKENPESPEATYILMSPNWKQSNESLLNYTDGKKLLEQKAEEYQKQQIAMFENQKS